jgi:hypothetical protein
LKESQARELVQNCGIFSEEKVRPLFRHLQDLLRLIQRTLKKRQGDAYKQVVINLLHVDFHINAPISLKDLTGGYCRLLPKHPLYSAMETFLYMLTQELNKFPVVKESAFLPGKPILNLLKLTYEGEPVSVVFDVSL